MEKLKVSLMDAANDLEALCEEVDSAEEIDSLLQARFQSSLGDLKSSVDRRIRYITYADTMAKQAKEMVDSWTKRRKSFERTLEWLRDNTKNLMKLSDVPFKGYLGSFRLQKNSVASLTTVVGTQCHSFDYISAMGTGMQVDNLEGVPTSLVPYVIKLDVYVFDKTRLREDLANGKEIPGAKLEHGDHVRISLEK